MAIKASRLTSTERDQSPSNFLQEAAFPSRHGRRSRRFNNHNLWRDYRCSMCDGRFAIRRLEYRMS
jgi:hypothetical protein